MTLLTRDTIGFLAGLRANNDRGWFKAHNADYRAYVKHAGEDFARALADALEAATSEAHQYRIFRIHRDVRFSKDKTPYNAQLHISLSPGGGCSVGGPAWMFGLEPDRLTLGAGIFTFAAAQLGAWRMRIAADEGEGIAEMLDGLEAAGVHIGKPELKRVPAPYAPDHRHAPLLRRKGLTGWIDTPDADVALGLDGPTRCARELIGLRGLFDLLRGL
jgi:uncharacterized protein (TIGR02453 family)